MSLYYRLWQDKYVPFSCALDMVEEKMRDRGLESLYNNHPDKQRFYEHWLYQHGVPVLKVYESLWVPTKDLKRAVRQRKNLISKIKERIICKQT